MTIKANIHLGIREDFKKSVKFFTIMGGQVTQVALFKTIIFHCLQKNGQTERLIYNNRLSNNFNTFITGMRLKRRYTIFSKD